MLRIQPSSSSKGIFHSEGRHKIGKRRGGGRKRRFERGMCGPPSLGLLCSAPLFTLRRRRRKHILYLLEAEG